MTPPVARILIKHQPADLESGSVAPHPCVQWLKKDPIFMLSIALPPSLCTADGVQIHDSDRSPRPNAFRLAASVPARRVETT